MAWKRSSVRTRPGPPNSLIRSATGDAVSRRHILTDYVLRALEQAVYDKLEDETFAARISGCPGVVAFAPTLRSCERELRSALEDLILLGLKLHHPLPLLSDIDQF